MPPLPGLNTHADRALALYLATSVQRRSVLILAEKAHADEFQAFGEVAGETAFLEPNALTDAPTRSYDVVVVADADCLGSELGACLDRVRHSLSSDGFLVLISSTRGATSEAKSPPRSRGSKSVQAPSFSSLPAAAELCAARFEKVALVAQSRLATYALALHSSPLRPGELVFDDSLLDPTALVPDRLVLICGQILPKLDPYLLVPYTSAPSAERGAGATNGASTVDSVGRDYAAMEHRAQALAKLSMTFRREIERRGRLVRDLLFHDRLGTVARLASPMASPGFSAGLPLDLVSYERELVERMPLSNEGSMDSVVDSGAVRPVLSEGSAPSSSNSSSSDEDAHVRREEVAELRRRLEEVAAEREGALRRLAGSEQTLQEYEKTIDRLLHESHALTLAVEALRGEREGIRARLTDAERTNAEGRSTNAAMQRAPSLDLAELERRLGQCEQSLRARELERDDAKSALAEARAELESLSRAIYATGASETAFHTKASQELDFTNGDESAFDAAASQRASDQRLTTRPSDEVTQMQARIEALTQDIEDREVLMRSLVAQIEERDDRVRALEQRMSAFVPGLDDSRPEPQSVRDLERTVARLTDDLRLERDARSRAEDKATYLAEYHPDRIEAQRLRQVVSTKQEELAREQGLVSQLRSDLDVARSATSKIRTSLLELVGKGGLLRDTEAGRRIQVLLAELPAR